VNESRDSLGREGSRSVWGRRLAIVLCASAISLVGLELAVDRYLPVLGQIYELDPELLHNARPNARRIQPMHASRLREGDVARVLVTTGAEGFRGRSLARPASRPRVLVLGDSFVMAENVPLERTFVERLARSLERALGDGTAIEGVNAGRSGYGPDQALLLLRRQLDDVDPDVLVCVLCAHNDLGDLARNKLFRLDENGRLATARPRIGDRMRAEFARRSARARGLGLERLWRFWGERETRRPVNDMPDGTIDLYLTALGAQFAEHFVQRDDEVVSLFEDVYDADVAIAPDSVAVQAKLALMAEILRAITQVAEERRLPLHFVVVPSAVDACPGFGIRVDPLRHPSYSPDHLVTAMGGAVERAGGVATDLTATLRTAGGDRWVGGTDIHWNANGQAASAEAVAADLWNRGDVRRALTAP